MKLLLNNAFSKHFNGIFIWISTNGFLCGSAHSQFFFAVVVSSFLSFCTLCCCFITMFGEHGVFSSFFSTFISNFPNPHSILAAHKAILYVIPFNDYRWRFVSVHRYYFSLAITITTMNNNKKNRMMIEKSAKQWRQILKWLFYKHKFNTYTPSNTSLATGCA